MGYVQPADSQVTTGTVASFAFQAASRHTMVSRHTHAASRGTIPVSVDLPRHEEEEMTPIDGKRGGDLEGQIPSPEDEEHSQAS